MRRLFALTVLIATVLSLRLRADAPDDQYVQVYHLIQEADDLKAGGQSELAKNKYLEAQAVLKKLQTIYPEWNKKVIEYRLSYIELKLDSSKAGTAPAAAPAARPAPSRPATQPRLLPPPRLEPVPPPVNPEIQEKNNEIVGLKAIVSRLEADRNILEAKLKEALAAQPAAVDPRELAKADERIKQLEKEKDLLQVSLDKEKARKPEAPARPAVDVDQLQRQIQTHLDTIAALNAEKKVLEGQAQNASRASLELAALKTENETLKRQAENRPDIKPAPVVADQSARVTELERQARTQTDVIASLRTENENLARRLATPPPAQPAPAPAAGDPSRVVADLQRQVKSQGDTITALTNQRRDLETRLQAAPKDSGEAKSLRAEVDSLKKQLASAQAKSTDKTSAESAEVKALKNQIDSLQKALAASQAKATEKVPQESPRKIASLQSSVKELEQKNSDLQKQNKDLDSRLKAAAKPVSENARAKQLEKERDDLLKKLNEATRASYEKKSRNKQQDNSSQELAALKARLGVLEAEKVPYTKEELALFRATPLTAAPKVEPAATAAAPAEPKKAVNEPPAGSSVLVAEATRAFNARRLDEAEAKYKQVLKMDEKNVYTLGNLAAIQIEANRYDEAEKNLNAALAIDAQDAFSLRLLGILKFRQDKYDAALDALSRSAQLDAKNPETENYLGITLSQKGQRAAAESALRRAIQLAPNYAGAHHNLAVVYATQQPPFIELAKWHYQKAVSNGHPQNAELEKILEGKKSN